MNVSPWYQEYLEEMQMADAARKEGNEGRARVCARRAVGAVVKEYYLRKGVDLSQMGAYDRLFYLINQEDTPSEVREIVKYFVMRVTPDRALPLPVDLIKEARKILGTLLPDMSTSQATCNPRRG